MWRGEPVNKKYGSTGMHVKDALEAHKHSGLEQNTLLIESFKSGAFCCLLVEKTGPPTSCSL